MNGDLLTFSLLTVSSVFIIVNPLTATLTFLSLTPSLPQVERLQIAKDAARYALGILLVFAIGGGYILSLFGISLQAFRIAGGILLFYIGMEMVYARTSRTRLTATEKYESQDGEDIAVMPLATPIISGPGAITTAIVLMNEAVPLGLSAMIIVVVTVIVVIAITYVMMRNADLIVNRIGTRQYRAINRLMGMLLIAIAVQFVINGVKEAFPIMVGVTG
jgi:multiple antibiotic resistance protein